MNLNVAPGWRVAPGRRIACLNTKPPCIFLIRKAARTAPKPQFHNISIRSYAGSPSPGYLFLASSVLTSRTISRTACCRPDEEIPALHPFICVHIRTNLLSDVSKLTAGAAVSQMHVVHQSNPKTSPQTIPTRKSSVQRIVARSVQLNTPLSAPAPSQQHRHNDHWDVTFARSPQTL